jgi:hypothetical protein
MLSISYIVALLICGTWLYVTEHRLEGLVFWVIAALIWVVTAFLTRG